MPAWIRAFKRLQMHGAALRMLQCMATCATFSWALLDLPALRLWKPSELLFIMFKRKRFEASVLEVVAGIFTFLRLEVRSQIWDLFSEVQSSICVFPRNSFYRRLKLDLCFGFSVFFS